MFDNPLPQVIENRHWNLLILYFEKQSCFKSGNWPTSGFKHVKYLTRKGNLAWREEGPYLCSEPGTTPKAEFGDHLCDEVGACYVGLSFRYRLAIEMTVLALVLGNPTKIMRVLAKSFGLTLRSAYRLRHKAFHELAKACEKRGL